MPRSCYLISYDIPDDKQRLKTSHLLEGYGERVQYSVFEVWTTAEELQKLRARLKPRVEEGGNIRIYRLCASCRAEREVLGEGEPTEEADLYVV